MSKIVKIFHSPSEMALEFALEMAAMIADSNRQKKTFTIALSGGSTPKMLYSVLGVRFADTVQWRNVHFFWGDERCVPPEDPESNYGMTRKVLLDKIKIPLSNIHRIMGENDPSEEAVRYSKQIEDFTAERGGWPVFNLIILGLGEDGHTASIFPGNNKLFNSEKICDIAVHPVSFQKRITITGKVINNAENVIFLVEGANKAEVVSSIFRLPGTIDYPAALIKPISGVLKWYIDDAAAKKIDNNNL